MGWQIETTNFAREINFTAGARLVMGWVWKFNPPPSDLPLDEIAGFSDAKPLEVQAANGQVPIDFISAKIGGWIDDETINEREFNECREFLAYAALWCLGITGSW